MAKFNVENKRAETNMFKPSLLKVPAFTGRKYRSAETVQKRKEDLLRDGQLQPIGIRKLEDGTPEIVFGFTRYFAALEIEKNDNPEFRLECKTLSAEDVKQYAILTIRENIDRTDLSDIDIAYNQEEMRTTHGMNNKEIAELFRCDPAKVTRLKKLLTLAPEVQDAVHDGKVATNAAIEYAPLTHDEQRSFLQRGIVKQAEIVEEIRRMKQAAAVQAAIPATTTVVDIPLATAVDDPTNELAGDLSNKPVAAEQVTLATNDAATQPSTLNFDKLNTDAAPAKPNAALRQRTIQQVKTTISNYITEDTNIVTRTFAAAVLAYIDGALSEFQLEDVVRRMEGNPERKASATPPVA